MPPPIWNNAKAVLRASTIYNCGQGVPKDEAHALQYYQRAAELGSAIAMHNVSAFYVMGRGIAVVTVQAIAWYRRAAAHGYVPTMNNLDVLYSAQLQDKPN